MTFSIPVSGSIVVIFVTLGLLFRRGNSTFSHLLPGLNSEPMTARHSMRFWLCILRHPSFVSSLVCPQKS